MSTNGKLFERIRNECLLQLRGTDPPTDAELALLIDRKIEEEGEKAWISLSERLRLREMLFNSFKKLDILQELIDDPKVTEIMINGKDRIFLEDETGIHRWNGGFESEEKLENIIRQIVSRVNRRVNTSEPIVDARLPDGSRVHVVLPPVSLEGPTVTIRKFPEPVTMEKLIAWGSITPEAADFLKTAVRARYNVFVSGGTSSGKTTLLNALSAYVPSGERIITIEDSAELQITHIPNLVRLETRDANAEGQGRIDMSQLLKALSAGDITAMLIRLGNAILVLEAHLLGDENLLLSPERIYVKPGSVDLSFCPAFSAEESFEERLRPLMQEIFLHADTRDPQTLALASELLKVALRKHYRMHDLMDVLQNGARPADGEILEKEGIQSVEETGAVPHLLSKKDHGEAGEPLFSMYDPQFAECPEKEEAEKEEKGGFFGRIKAMASAAVSWVRGDDEIESTELITFEDHT